MPCTIIFYQKHWAKPRRVTFHPLDKSQGFSRSRIILIVFFAAAMGRVNQIFKVLILN